MFLNILTFTTLSRVTGTLNKRKVYKVSMYAYPWILWIHYHWNKSKFDPGGIWTHNSYDFFLIADFSTNFTTRLR